MKLATYRDGSRDGQLMVVARNLATTVAAAHIAPCLQAVLDDWNFLAPQLETLYTELNSGKARHAVPFDPSQCLAPLPRAYQWADGSAYVNHVELVRKARGAAMPASFWTDPLIYQGGSDDLRGPTEDLLCIDPAFGLDFEAEVAVITGDVPIGASPAAAADAVRLLMLVNDATLRHLVPDELAKGFGFFQSKPASHCSPVVVTPDELAAVWQDGRVHLPLLIHWNDRLVGQPNAGVDMVFNFPSLIAHVAKTRRLGAGSIIGGGTVSNVDRSRGYACIAEQRCLEILDHGAPVTPFLQAGDRIRIEMLDVQGHSVFGAIDQQVSAGNSAVALSVDETALTPAKTAALTNSTVTLT